MTFFMVWLFMVLTKFSELLHGGDRFWKDLQQTGMIDCLLPKLIQ